MSAAKALHLIEKLTEANISKETATELLEYVEQKQTNAVTKDYFEARITSVEDKITGVEEKLEAKITGLKLFTGFNTALLLAILARLFLG